MPRLVINYEDEAVLEVNEVNATVEVSFHEGICELVDGMNSEEFNSFLWQTVAHFIKTNEVKSVASAVSMLRDLLRDRQTDSTANETPPAADPS